MNLLKTYEKLTRYLGKPQDYLRKFRKSGPCSVCEFPCKGISNLKCRPLLQKQPMWTLLQPLQSAMVEMVKLQGVTEMLFSANLLVSTEKTYRHRQTGRLAERQAAGLTDLVESHVLELFYKLIKLRFTHWTYNTRPRLKVTQGHSRTYNTRPRLKVTQGHWTYNTRPRLKVTQGHWTYYNTRPRLKVTQGHSRTHNTRPRLKVTQGHSRSLDLQHTTMP